MTLDYTSVIGIPTLAKLLQIKKRTRPRKGSVKGKMRTFNTHTDTTIFKWVAFNSLTRARKLQTSGKKSDDARTEGRIK